MPESGTRGAGSVTAEMVERGAIGLWLNYKSERGGTVSNRKLTPLAIQQGRAASDWRGVAIKEWYRSKARAVLEAALDAQ